MREIKFRAWDNIDKAMKSPVTLAQLMRMSSIDEHILYDYTIMQYTGLKDKHGVEIYEGDLLGGIFGDGGNIVYCEDCACYELNYPEHGCMACLGDVHWSELAAETGSVNNKLEVIGNIYENPELLEAE